MSRNVIEKDFVKVSAQPEVRGADDPGTVTPVVVRSGASDLSLTLSAAADCRLHAF